jgi:hypothetical protein
VRTRIDPPEDAWYPVALVNELRGKPLARQLLGRPVVVFSTQSGAAVLFDRCPHRSAALSAGRQVGGGNPVPLPRVAVRWCGSMHGHAWRRNGRQRPRRGFAGAGSRWIGVGQLGAG